MSTATMEETTASSGTIQKAEGPVENPLSLMDTSDFATFLDGERFNQMWRVASLFAKSQLVPQHFRGKVEDCFIACNMAIRLGVDPFMFMQNTYVVHGKPGMEAKLAIALINTSGIFDGGLKYERIGGDASKKDYKARVYAIRKDNGERVDGPWIDWGIVTKEGWDRKDGSKWMTIPGLMFDYRAATWFGRLYCPERLMGMQTADEIEDVAPARPVPSRTITASSAISETRSKLAAAGEVVTPDGEVTPAASTDPHELTDAERAEIARKEAADWEAAKKGVAK